MQLIVPLLASFPFKEHITFLNKNSNVNITSSIYFILIALMFKNRTQKLFVHYKAAKENQSHILVPNQRNVANITKVTLFLFVPVLIIKGLFINNKRLMKVLKPHFYQDVLYTYSYISHLTKRKTSERNLGFTFSSSNHKV